MAASANVAGSVGGTPNSVVESARLTARARGASLAHEAARELVLFLRRPGGQPQVSVSLASQASEMTALRELAAPPRTDGPGLKEIAAAVGFGSVDVMRRAFLRLLGITPRRYRESR
ncbi:MAG TPA: hypothetical protein VFM88_04950 [Vicinamibacteria bacterium]|nr:hypothetical protein [Vicinamibacteria bacterium]